MVSAHLVILTLLSITFAYERESVRECDTPVCKRLRFRGLPNILTLVLSMYRSARITRCAALETYGTLPTTNTLQSNLLIFWRETPQRHPLRGIGAIFEFHPRIRDTVD